MESWLTKEAINLRILSAGGGENGCWCPHLGRGHLKRTRQSSLPLMSSLPTEIRLSVFAGLLMTLRTPARRSQPLFEASVPYWYPRRRKRKNERRCRRETTRSWGSGACWKRWMMSVQYPLTSSGLRSQTRRSSQLRRYAGGCLMPWNTVRIHDGHQGQEGRSCLHYQK